MTGLPGDVLELGEAVGDPPHRRKEAVDAVGSDLVFAFAPMILPRLSSRNCAQAQYPGPRATSFCAFPLDPGYRVSPFGLARHDRHANLTHLHQLLSLKLS